MPLEIEFDEAKDQVNRSKHDVSLALGRLVIENEIACIPDEQTDYGEERWRSYGFVADRLFACVYTMRLEVYRVISVRPRPARSTKQSARDSRTMAVVKVTKKLAEQAARDIDWKKLDTMSDAQLESAARSDPDNRPPNERDLKRLAAAAMIRRIRKRIGLTQAGFARRYKVPVATLRDWEQGRRAPETTVIAYLKVIDRMPERVQAALAPSRPRRRQRAAT